MIYGIERNKKGQFKKGWGTHRQSNTREYRIWWDMIGRCYKPKNPRFKDYGGRGILVCERWLNPENFLIDMGQRPSKNHSLDRIDNNGNYAPNNCRWATREVQYRNRRTNVFIELDFKLLILKDACRLLGLSDSSVSYKKRIYNISHQAALNELMLEKGAW